MAGSPKFKVHSPSGEYVASCRYAEDAAAMAGIHGEGSKVKHFGRIIWHEGAETVLASVSYDEASDIMWERIRQRQAEVADRWANYIAKEES